MTIKSIQKTIPLEQETLVELKQIAEVEGIAPATVGRIAIRKYIREWKNNERRTSEPSA